jgi:hypothetical protein
MLSNVSSAIFTEAESVSMTPIVSAEWNQNLFNAPYLTMAGDGTKMSLSLTTGTVASVTVGAKPNFTTKSFTMSGGTGKVLYTVTANNGKAYKVITYVKTDNPTPVMISSYAKGTTGAGASSEEASSVGWRKIVTYVGVSEESDSMSSFEYVINARDISGSDTNAIVYFTVPEVYETTYFDYRNNSLWPTESVFTNFRPGESYVYSGNNRCSLPSNYRRITSPTIKNYTTPAYSPISAIVQNPKSYVNTPPVPVLKNVLPSSISQYKYFVSDPGVASPAYYPKITAIYEKPIITNKIVIKFNSIMTTPTINITIDGTTITVDESQSIAVPTSPDGLLVLYWTGSAWTKTKWSDSDMPIFSSTGELAQKTTISKITVKQVSKVNKTEFDSYDSDTFTEDLARMQIVEISPRLEIDLTDFVEDVSIEKSLDSKNNNLPISSTNSNSAKVTLSGIPEMSGGNLVPIFSSQSDSTATILSNMLRKGIKVYIGFNLDGYSLAASTNSYGINTYIPGGVFYSDSWNEQDIDSVSIQCFDVSKYLQSTPSPDYVVKQKDVLTIITNLLEMAGFTDYDYDSLYNALNSKAITVDLFYYFNNSKDTTLIDAINKILLPYQIAAYIDEYSIMKFKGLHEILTSTTSNISISDSSVMDGGFSISNKAKPGKISIRYKPPRTKTSPSLQNLVDKSLLNSPSFIFTSSGDVVWQQQSIDSVGFNYLDANMSKDDNKFKINVNDVQDRFHTFDRDSQGYVVIEDEVVSFLYKEYAISKTNSFNILGTYSSLSALKTAHPTGLNGHAYLVSTATYFWDVITNDWALFDPEEATVSVKNDLEYLSEVNKYIREQNVQLVQQKSTITGVSGSGTEITYTANNTFTVGEVVTISGINPDVYNSSTAKITARTSTTFKIAGTANTTYVSGGTATGNMKFDTRTDQTGYITNVKRGLFGTVPTDHNIIESLSGKGLSKAIINFNTETITLNAGLTSIVDDHDAQPLLPSVKKIQLSVADNDHRVLIYPTDHLDIGYQTFLVKFNLVDPTVSSLSGVFFNASAESLNLDTNAIDCSLYYEDPSYVTINLQQGDNRYEANITALYNQLVGNFSKILKPQTVSNGGDPEIISDNPLTLKLIHYVSDGTDGEDGTIASPKSILSAFLNNIEVTDWKVFKAFIDPETGEEVADYIGTGVNKKTGAGKRPSLPVISNEGKVFGYYTQLIEETLIGEVTCLRELYATKKPLKHPAANHFFQDAEFLNGLIQDQPLHSLSPSYMMQTNPEISKINVYDVQYTTPAAISANIFPIQYMWRYYPENYIGGDLSYQKKKLISENALSYSSILNTGYRAKFAIANSSPHLVFLNSEASKDNNFDINLNLYTNEIIAPADTELVEYVVDQSNAVEVAQMDAEWIQSKEAAEKTLRLIQQGLEGFSKDVSLSIFGNPLIQVGDIVTLSYSLNGISQQKYVVHSVAQNFSNGLSTSLTLNRIQE